MLLMWTVVLMRKYGLVTSSGIMSHVHNVYVVCKSYVKQTTLALITPIELLSDLSESVSGGIVRSHKLHGAKILHVRGTTECGRRLTAAANAPAVCSTLLALAQS